MHIRYGTISAALLCLALVAPAWSQHTQEDVDRLLRRHLQFLNKDHSPGTHKPLLQGDAADPTSAKTFFSMRDVEAWLPTQQIGQEWDASANAGAGAWVDTSRITYTRNDDGAVTSLLIEYRQDGDWVNALRITDELDSQNQVTQSISETWDPEANAGAGAWIPVQRVTNTYNARGRTLVTSSELWMEDEGEYVLYFRTTSTYDGSGERELERLTESALFGDLEPSSRQTFTYDDAGNVIEELSESYLAGTWMNSQRLLFEYDGNDQIVEATTQTWDPVQNDWVNSYQTTTAYSPDSNDPTEVIETQLYWDAGTSTWTNSNRYIETSSATEWTYTEQVWDPDANGGQGEWLNEHRSVTTIDSGGFAVEHAEQLWDPDTDDWVNDLRTTIEYDDNNNPTVWVEQFWMSGAWVNDSRLLTTYQDFDPTASEDETPIARFELGPNYPNPFTEKTVISYSLAAPDHVTIEVFDVLGRRVETLVDAVAPAGTHTVRFESGELAGGLYVYRMRGTSIQKSRMMTVVR